MARCGLFGIQNKGHWDSCGGVGRGFCASLGATLEFAVDFWENVRMIRYKILCLAVWLVLAAATAAAQACPKVTYINPTATVQSLVFSVNCLIDTTERARSGRPETAKAGLMVEALPITRPRHTRTYGTVAFALLAVSADNTTTALVTPESPSGSVSGTAGAECKVKINADNTVDGQCKQTGGVLYVIYHD
jgi:hypothetical protein